MPAPNTPQDIIDRLRAMERQIAELNGRLNIRPALNTIVGGSVTIKGGGALVVQDTSGDSVLRIGQVDPDVDGEPQQATVIRRMDGSLAFAVWTSATTGAQPVRIYDRDSGIIFADDVVAGGLAIPWLPLPLPVASAGGSFFSSTSGSFATVARSIGWFHHPRVYVDIAMSFGAGTTGQSRLVIGGDTIATFSSSGSGSFDLPDWEWSGVPQAKSIELQIQRNSGANSVFAQMRSLYGRQS